jgi:hypothetical protein
MVSKAKEKEFCWREKNGERAYGPFPSREAALEDARDLYHGDDRAPKSVMIGSCHYAFAPKYVPDFYDVIERIEEVAWDDSFSFWDNGEIFDVADGAKEAYDKMLRAWAEKYLSSTVWCTDEEEEMELALPETKDAE